MLEAERQFRRVMGYRDLAKLANAVEREVATTPAATASSDHGAGGRRYTRMR